MVEQEWAQWVECLDLSKCLDKLLLLQQEQVPQVLRQKLQEQVQRLLQTQLLLVVVRQQVHPQECNNQIHLQWEEWE